MVSFINKGIGKSIYKNIYKISIILFLLGIIMYLVFNHYHKSQEQTELFIDVTPNPTSNVVSEFVKRSPKNTHIVMPTPTPYTNQDLLEKQTESVTGVDSLSDLHSSVNDLTVNEYDVKNTLNPMMTSTMTTLSPVIFNINDVINTTSPTNNSLDETIATALLPSGTPMPTIHSNEMPTSVPTNNFSMPFDTSKITSNYSGMDLNQGPFFGVTQQNFNLNASGDL
jgi:hypothetical protein